MTNDVYERDFVSSLTVGKADGLFFGECAVRGAAGVLACRLGRCFYDYAVKVAHGDPHPAPLTVQLICLDTAVWLIVGLVHFGKLFILS